MHQVRLLIPLAPRHGVASNAVMHINTRRRWYRRVVRRLGVGRLIQRLRSLRALTLRGAIDVSIAKRRDLARILDAQPRRAESGPLEVHMLLHHARLLEGMW